MLLADVNVLVYAFRRDAPGHQRYASWLAELIDSDTAFALADLVLSGFLRIVTHPAIFSQPSPVDRAIAFVEQVRHRPPAVTVAGPVFTIDRSADAVTSVVTVEVLLPGTGSMVTAETVTWLVSVVA